MIDAPPLFEFAAEHRALRELLRQCFTTTGEAEPVGWRRIAASVGVGELLFGTDGGEYLGTAIDLAILAEEAGAALYSGPLLSAAIAGALAEAVGDEGWPAVSALRSGAVGAAVAGGLIVGEEMPVATLHGFAETARMSGRIDPIWDCGERTLLLCAVHPPLGRPSDEMRPGGASMPHNRCGRDEPGAPSQPKITTAASGRPPLSPARGMPRFGSTTREHEPGGDSAALAAQADAMCAPRTASGTPAGRIGHGPKGHHGDEFTDPAGGFAVAVIDTAAAGIAVARHAGLDLSRTFGRAECSGVEPELVITGEAADRALAAMRTRAELMLAAESLGVAQQVLDRTVEYVGGRVQFGRSIGSFQAVKHRLADLVSQVELARSAVYGTAWALTADPGAVETRIDSAVAAGLAGDAAVSVTKAAVQLHGGIAITWEHWAHRYFRRAHSVAAMTGGGARYRRQVAELVDRRDGRS
ncbi:acyl-CoA dehydrogenase family protein [Nocardia inohanensis]|uniref:acyl-CoA dehydrogenase family protein n=1 Tax=Nocardia inohanensis TaxID=209246 RepID=UPI00082AC6BD|nr:acyl-CoA dehydrogenase family protein [Nocardia inohanensis]